MVLSSVLGRGHVDVVEKAQRQMPFQGYVVKSEIAGMRGDCFRVGDKCIREEGIQPWEEKRQVRQARQGDLQEHRLVDEGTDGYGLTK